MMLTYSGEGGKQLTKQDLKDKPTPKKTTNKKKIDKNIDEELIIRWGRGYSLEEYEFLDNEYTKWVMGYECDSPAQEVLFEEIAKTQLDIRKAREDEKPVDKLVKSLQDLLGSSNVKPVQESGANSLEQASFGVLIKKWENERPIPKPLPEFEDVDNIRKYITVWFLGHLSKMLDINNSYSDAYEKEMLKYTVNLPEISDEEDNISEEIDFDKENNIDDVEDV